MPDQTPAPSLPANLTVTKEVDHVALYQKARSDLIDLLVNKPLYAHLDTSKPVGELISALLDEEADLRYDQYCVNCQMMTPWAITIRPHQTARTLSEHQSYLIQPTVMVLHATCLRVQHFHTYVLWRNNSNVTKIGQNPSMAALAFGELKAVDKGMLPQDRAELGKALGLFAHDTPLGAFVYLRRVFERIIERAHEKYVRDHGQPIEDWKRLKMIERVTALAAQLPPGVLTNKRVFSLLSKGIHELTDEDASILFPLVKAVIFQMLGDEQRLAAAEVQRRELEAALQQALSKFGERDA